MKIPGTFVPDKGLEEKVEEMLNPKKRKFKYAPKYNTLKVKDKHVQYFYDLWCEQAFTSTGVQKSFLAEAYCIQVLGVSDKTFKDFSEGVYNKVGQPPYSPEPKRLAEIEFAEREIGLRQGGAVEMKGNFELFWNLMAINFPSDYTKEDVEFLVSGGDFSVFPLMDQFETFSGHPLLRALRTNAHVYK